MKISRSIKTLNYLLH